MQLSLFNVRVADAVACFVSVILCILFWLLLRRRKMKTFFTAALPPCLFTHFVVSVNETLGHEDLLSLQLLIDQSSGA